MTVRKPRILLVDDEESLITALADTLSSHGYEVQTAYSGSEALPICKRESFDLLVTDINMPGMDGIELIRRVREVNEDMRVIFITGFPSHESQDEAFKLGSLNYIVKPFSTDRFLELIKKALNDGEGDSLVGAVELTIEDLIQMYAMERKSVVLKVGKGKDVGRIYFNKGTIVHAETDNNEGEEAFYEIQSWRGGRFNVEPLKGGVDETIERSVDSLILEGACQLDEMNVGKGNGDKTQGDKKDDQHERRDYMPSMIEEINSALKELGDNAPGLSLALLIDNEGLPIAQHAALAVAEGTTEKAAVASVALLGLARRTSEQLDLEGFQEVLVKTNTGYVYAIAVGGYVLVVRTDQNVTLGALFMTVRAAQARIGKAIGIA